MIYSLEMSNYVSPLNSILVYKVVFIQLFIHLFELKTTKGARIKRPFTLLLNINILKIET